MSNEIPQPRTPELEANPAVKDLRAELEADLKSEFAFNLAQNGTLPKVASESLVALLSANGPIAADVIALLALKDPEQLEEPNE